METQAHGESLEKKKSGQEAVLQKDAWHLS